MQEEKQKNSPIKQRILQFVDTLGISKRDFYAKTGISRGTLESCTGITEDTITKVFAIYSELNPSWLLTGRDNMLTIQNGVENNCNPNCNPNCNLSPNSEDFSQQPSAILGSSVERKNTKSLSIYNECEVEEKPSRQDGSSNELVMHLVEQLNEKSEEIGALKQEVLSLKNRLAQYADIAQNAQSVRA